jgi:serine/threonine protein kinase
MARPEFAAFEVLEPIGAGSRSTVYKARDRALGRIVALKVYSETNDRPTLARIEQEAKVWAQLDHPNIATLIDLRFEQGSIYLVVEYVEGSNVKTLLERAEPGVLGIRQSVEITMQLMQALDYLRRRGVIHRDVKPSNILVRAEDDRVLLTDFSTGRPVEDYRAMTLDGSTVGSLDYMSPEQRIGRPGVLSDVYSAGVTFLEMLTGSADIGLQGLDADIARRRPATPQEVAELLKRMLADDAEERISASEALRALELLEKGVDWSRVASEDRPRALAAKPPTMSRGPALPFAPRPAPVPRDVDGGTTVVETAPGATASAFFLSRIEATQAVEKSAEFFSGHLTDDYQALLNEARGAFRLWLVCVGVAFVILALGVTLMFLGRPIEGGLTLASDALVLFIQRLFKQREDYYLQQAETKKAHLQRGSYWNLAIQTVEGISDPGRRSEKVEEITDALIGLIRNA